MQEEILGQIFLTVMDKPDSWLDIFSRQEVHCMLLWTLAIGLDFTTEKLLKEVQALPSAWEDLKQGDIS